jgi:hypothetical protein
VNVKLLAGKKRGQKNGADWENSIKEAKVSIGL